MRLQHEGRSIAPVFIDNYMKSFSFYFFGVGKEPV